MVFRPKKHEICRARARVCICMLAKKKSTGCQLMTPSTFWEWFAVRFLAVLVQRTEILLLHACCSKKLVCTCISIPFLEKLFSTLTRFFLYSCKFHTAVWLLPWCPLGYWLVTIQVTTRDPFTSITLYSVATSRSTRSSY